MSNFLGLTKKDYNLIKHKGYITKMTKEAIPTKKKRTPRKTTKAKEQNKAAMANTPQPITSNEDPSHNNKVKEEDKSKNNTKEFNLNDYPRYTQTRYNVLLDRYMRQNHLFAEAHSLALRDLKLQKLI